jgi:hypothetical protein
MSLNPMATVFDALLEIGRHPPDIVLADIGLPGVNGASFLQSLARSRYGDYVTLGGIVPVDSSMPAPEATTQIRLLRFPLDAVEVRALCDAVPTPRGERPSKERIPYENSTVSG